MKTKLTLLLLLFFFTAQAQNIGGALLLTMNYGNQFSAGDLKDRFGNNLYTGLNLEYITEKGNIIFGVNYSLLFGSNVKEDVLSNLRDANGVIYGAEFASAQIELRQRGSYPSVHVGKLFGLSEKNRRSGIRVHLGVGLLQHKVRVQDDPNAFVTQISGDKRKGYDRLTNGLAISQFIGYQHLSKNRLANFFVGLEVIEGFTQNRRSINADTQLPDLAQRTDILWGFKLGWILPFYIGQPAETIFY